MTGTVLIAVFLLLGLTCETTVQPDCSYKCRTETIQDRARCALGCKIQKEERSTRIQRSTNNDCNIKTLSIFKGSEHCHGEFNKCKDRKHGIKNPDAEIREIMYSAYRNKTIARIVWDPPAECIQKQNVCTGYFVKLGIDVIVERIYCQTVAKNINYVILNESTGFNSKIGGFAVNVKAIPYQSEGRTRLVYKRPPPPPEKLAKPIILRVTTPPPLQATFSKETNFSSQEPLSTLSTISTVNSDTVEDGQSDNKRSTTLIFSLCVFTVVVIASLGLVIKWIYNKHKKDQDLSIPGPYPMVKGTIYVSYLPEKATINQINEIYSWLKSRNIEVVMDQMYNDQKLYNSIGPKRFGEKFLRQADKVIMIVTPGYLKLCWLDDTVDIESIPRFDSLNEERLYSEVTHIKNELSTTLKYGPIRFIPVLVNVPDDYLPKWLQKLTSVKWPDDGKTKTFLNLLKGEDLPVNTKYEKFSFI